MAQYEIRSRDLALFDSYAYVITEDRSLWVLDMSDPDTLQPIHRLPYIFSAETISVDGGHAFVYETSMHAPLEFHGDIIVFDLEDPRYPREVGRVSVPTDGAEPVLRGGYLFFVDKYQGLTVYDVDKPGEIRRLSEWVREDDRTPIDVEIEGDTIYVADPTGVTMYRFTPPAPEG